MQRNNLEIAVLDRLGIDSNNITHFHYSMLNEIAENSISCGYPGFETDNDFISFFDANMTDIIDLLDELALSLNEEIFTMIASLNYLVRLDLSTVNIAEAIYFHGEYEYPVKIALAKVAADSVVFDMTDEIVKALDS